MDCLTPLLLTDFLTPLLTDYLTSLLTDYLTPLLTDYLTRQVMSLGRKSPGFSLGNEAEIYDLRMYLLNP